jgi:ParB family chromosome partitioning protein
VVRPAERDLEGRSFEIVSGERRWRASQMAGLSSISASVREVDTEQMLELALVENLQRQDLDAIERATGYQQMMKALNVTQEQVAEKVGLKRSTVANHLRLLDLPVPAQDAVRRSLITMGHARALLGLADPARVLGLVERIAREDLSVRDVERLVRDAGRVTNQGKAVIPPPSAPAPWVRELETRLRGQLGTAVQVRNAPGYRGQIVIEYFDRTDLDRLCERLAPRDEIR